MDKRETFPYFEEIRNKLYEINTNMVLLQLRRYEQDTGSDCGGGPVIRLQDLDNLHIRLQEINETIKYLARVQ